jgi:iron(III) transport system substrate-binding protein
MRTLPPITRHRITRRTALGLLGAAALPFGAVRAAPEIGAVTPELIAAAKKEGKAVWYTSVELGLAEKVGKAFEEKFGIPVQVERSGAERVFQRIGQEQSSNIHACDAVNSSDASHLIVWKKQGLLAPWLPEDVAKHYPAQYKDPDGMFATWRIMLSPIGYNTKLVKPEDAPKSFADLLDPKWKGKLVKAHPGYSGTIATTTFEMARDLGWDYFAKLSQQRVMQVQSAVEPAKKVAQGERAVSVDGGDYVLQMLKDQGAPVAMNYPTEGTPLITGPTGIFKDAPHPNAARLFSSWCFGLECQQMVIDVGALRSAHPGIKERPDRPPLAQIKLMKDDPEGVEQQIEQIKAKYTSYFKT